MVCVLPTSKLNPHDIVKRIERKADVCARLSFTYKNAPLHLEQTALWVKISWSKELRNLLLHAFVRGNPVLDRFIREIMAEFMPGLVLTKDPADKAHSRALAQLIGHIGPMEDD
jgi:hypothetical protein